MHKSYELTFSGVILPGFDSETVKIDIQNLLKLDPAQIEDFFSGKPIIIKRGLQLDEAYKTKGALEKKGLLINLVEETTESSPTMKLEPLIGDDGQATSQIQSTSQDVLKLYVPPQATLSSKMAEDFDSEKAPGFFKFSFQGRYGRLNFLNLYWSVYGVMLALSVLIGFVARINEVMGLILMVGVCILIMFFYIRGMALRLHDLNKSGWYLLLLFLGIIPILGALFVLGFSIYMMCAKGTEGENNYGHPTKQGSIVGLVLTILSLVFMIAGIIFIAVMGINILALMAR